MRSIRMLAAGAVLLAMSGLVQAGEYKVSGVHNCCGACCKKITEALAEVDGVSDVTAKPKVADFTFAAPDDATARKAVAALAKAGFHGEVEGGKNVTFRDNSQVEKGKTQRLELVGVHNCCPGCSNAVEAAVKSVEGVQATVIAKNGRAVVVEGDFDGQAVVQALFKEGFHVRKKGARAGQPKKIEKKE